MCRTESRRSTTVDALHPRHQAFEYELLAKNAIGQVIMATPAISNGVIIVRGLKDVFAIGARR